ncbi:hypothetical protein SLEP1_g20925 [Rubroshorea leprosula]|uniref:DUF659 domain-containing protein n=1 Tax=Rubroshorea leprosula TaxID=152421 RepID=A0AAV5JA48_9ROSI|nr:hypothetical protein SLEP1_g20925 [Rubroshorea leprosula]
MWDAITFMGPGFKGPRYHDLRGPFLKCVVKKVNEWLLSLKSTWSINGCSIMADGWTNQRQQLIINFLVDCPKGSMFLKSIDTSGLTKDVETLERMFDEAVREVGVENVVQFITNNDASFKAAGKRGKEAVDPLNLENIDILADWVAEEPTFLDKDDYDVDWVAIDESLPNQILDDTDSVVYDEEDVQWVLENESEQLWVGVDGVSGYRIPPNNDPYNYVHDC